MIESAGVFVARRKIAQFPGVVLEVEQLPFGLPKVTREDVRRKRLLQLLATAGGFGAGYAFSVFIGCYSG